MLVKSHELVTHVLDNRVIRDTSGDLHDRDLGRKIERRPFQKAAGFGFAVKINITASDSNLKCLVPRH
jgi:hypothetical protein